MTTTKITDINTIELSATPYEGRLTEDQAAEANVNMIQSALNDLQGTGGKVQLNRGTFLINRTLNIPSNVSITGLNNETILDGRLIPKGDSHQRPFLFASNGTLVGRLQISSNLAEGQTILRVTGDLSEAQNGRLLLIRSHERQYLGGGDHLPFKEELQRIVGMDLNNGTITVDSGLLFNYLASSTLSAEIYEPTADVNIENLRINMGGVGSAHSGIHINLGYNIKIDNVIVDGAEHIGIQITRTYLFNIQNNHLLNSTSPSLIENFNSGYGVAIISSSCYGRIEHNVFDNCRHGITGGNHAPHHINVVNNLFTNGRIGYALGCHEPCMYWVMSGNTIQGCVSGINGRGMYLTIANNLVKNITGVGISVGGTSELRLPFAKEYIITNNRITNTDGRAIELRGQFGSIEGVIIEGNTCIKTLGIHVQASSNVLLHDNIIDQNEVTGNQVFGIHLVSCNSVNTLGNQLLGVRTHGINASNSDDLNMSNNIFTGGTSNGVIRVSNGQKLIMTNNQFQDLNVLSVFTSGVNNIIFVNNIITSNRSDNTNFQDATTIINKDNITV